MLLLRINDVTVLQHQIVLRLARIAEWGRRRKKEFVEARKIITTSAARMMKWQLQHAMKLKVLLPLAGLLSIGTLASFSVLADDQPHDLSDGFRYVEVASVADASEQLYGQKVYMSHDMRPLNPSKFAGPAVTVLLTKEENKNGSKALNPMLDIIDQAAPVPSTSWFWKMA